MKKSILGRVVSLALTLCVLFGCVPMGAAAEAKIDRVADPDTVHGWQRYFGPTTANTTSAGAVWMDKSVFTQVPDVTEYKLSEGVTMEDTGDNFLVVLSAIASNKSITGYEHIPTDTVIVLDMSSSMHNNGEIGYIGELADATNAALTKLLALNKNNRVGVVIYSGNVHNSTGASGESATTILMPLARYETTLEPDGEGVIEYLVATNEETDDEGRLDTISVNSGVTNVDDASWERKSRKYMTGTFIQDGIYAGMMELLGADTVVDGGLQDEVGRLPAIILMTDGVPTVVTDQFAGDTTDTPESVTNGYVEGTFNVYPSLGDNKHQLSSIGGEGMAFLTQLTASYAREMIDRHYGRAPLFYTLGFNISQGNYAYSVMNPTHSTQNINGWWKDYLAVNDGASVTITGNNNNTVTVTKNANAVKQGYVDGYYNAGSGEMTAAFEAIVRQIILQSLYYPTSAETGYKDVSGYIEFLDDVGEFMEVRSIKGVRLGDQLWTGEEFAESLSNGEIGTLDERNDLGDNFVWSLQERLGITGNQARDLIEHAWLAEELKYNGENDWSNYIKWYSDEDGKFIPYASENSTEIPEGAVKENRSYFMYGPAQDETGMRVTDMMYLTLRVETHLEKKTQQLVWKIPATLVPLFSYKITLTDEGQTISNGERVNISTTQQIAPIRLLYEVGLRSDIETYTLEEIIAAEKPGYAYKNEDGSYDFYTNQWNPETIKDPHPQSQVNMVAWFEPSVENERYYYTEKSTIYKKNGTEYTPYSGGKPDPEGEYYRRRIIFASDEGDAGAQGNATAQYVYERISKQALLKAESNGNGTWYIPKGTIYRYLEPYDKPKDDNPTDTVDLAVHPSVEQIGNTYFADTVLGNNGRLRVTPDTGIALFKVVQSTTAPNEKFSFTITRTDEKETENRSCRVVRGSTEKDASFENGVLKIDVAAGELVRILDLPAGAVYSITEESGFGHKLESITVMTKDDEEPRVVTEAKDIEITAGSQVHVTFVNELPPSPENDYGMLALKKLVSHNYKHGFDIPADKAFIFRVTFEKDTQNIYGNDVIYDADGKAYALDKNGTVKGNVAIIPNQEIVFTGLADGTKVTVEEIVGPHGGYVVEEIISVADSVDVIDENSVQVSVTGGKKASVTVHNQYKEPYLPATGDDSRLMIWTALLALCGIAAAVRMRKRV